MSRRNPGVGFACLEDILSADVSNVIYMMLDDHALHQIACASTQNRRNAMANNSLWNARFLREFGDHWKVWVDSEEAEAVHQLEQGSDKSKNYKKYGIVAQVFNPKFVDAPPGSRTFRPALGRFLIGAIGATSVGKTSAMYYYVQGKWIAEIPITIGSDFMSKYVLDEPSGEILQLSFVDTAGQERFRSIGRSFYRILQGCIVAFAVNSRPSFDEVDMWMAELKQNNPAVPVILVGFKADLSPSDRTVTAEEAEAKASSLNVPYLEASSKTGINVKKAYNILLRKAWKDRIAAAKTAPPPVTQNQILPPPSVFETLWRKVTGYFSS